MLVLVWGLQRCCVGRKWCHSRRAQDRWSAQTSMLVTTFALFFCDPAKGEETGLMLPFFSVCIGLPLCRHWSTTLSDLKYTLPRLLFIRLLPSLLKVKFSELCWYKILLLHSFTCLYLLFTVVKALTLQSSLPLANSFVTAGLIPIPDGAVVRNPQTSTVVCSNNPCYNEIMTL